MTSTNDPLVGHVLDRRYHVIERLARGGMATVYRATDTRLDRMVALKVMHIGLGDDAEFRRKFDREARAAARLSHPNVVSVFDQGDDGGRPYIVMELVEGITLRTVISREAPLAPLRALNMIEPVLSALAAAHEAGLVHRDIKPENVLISERGQIKVGDFGLARAISAQTSTATAGLLIGTVSYLPPELVVSGKADARSDVYSTGVVLFELLTGRKPHTGESPIQVAYAHVHNDVPRASAFRTAGPIPDYLDALIARATARNADARPHDARVMLTQVRRVRSALRSGIQADPELTQDLTVPLFALRAGTAETVVEEDARSNDSPVDPYAGTTALGVGPGVDDPVQRPGQHGQPGQPGRTEPPYQPARPVAEPLWSPPRAEDRRGDWERPVREDRTRTDQVGWSPGPGQEYTPTDIRFLSGPSTPTPVADPERPTSVDRREGRPAGVSRPNGPVTPRPVPPHRPVHRSRHRARGWIALLIVLLLTAIALTAGWYYAKGRFTTAPALTSMSRVKAQTIAEESGLQVDFSQRYSETVPAGVVIDTRPRPGGKILRGGLIDAVVSKGPERFPMPKVVGLSRTAAEAALTRSHLATGSVDRRYSETVAKDIVLDASVDTGKPLKRDTRIDLVVSAGRRPIPVTDFTGKAADEAAAALKKAGFTVQVSTEHSDTVPQGSVIRQSPKSGTGHKGDEINLVQSLGPELVTVPQVKSWGVEAAKKKLEDEGFQVRTAHSSLVYLGLGYVESTDPAGGTKARKGSTVTLNLI